VTPDTAVESFGEKGTSPVSAVSLTPSSNPKPDSGRGSGWEGRMATDTRRGYLSQGPVSGTSAGLAPSGGIFMVWSANSMTL